MLHEGDQGWPFAYIRCRCSVMWRQIARPLGVHSCGTCSHVCVCTAHAGREGSPTMPNSSLFDQLLEVHPQLIWGMSCPEERQLVTWHAALHAGPITASTLCSPPSGLPIAANPCGAIHPESSQWYSNWRPSSTSLLVFTILTVRSAAPRTLLPPSHDLFNLKGMSRVK